MRAASPAPDQPRDARTRRGVVAGVPLNPLITGGDYWTNEGSANNNAMLLELKHPFVHHFSADAQFQWAKSMDTDGSGPYYEDAYFPENPGYSYGRSEFNVGKSVQAIRSLATGHLPRQQRMDGEDRGRLVAERHLPVPHWLPLLAELSASRNRSIAPNAAIYNLRPSIWAAQASSDHSNDAFINNTKLQGPRLVHRRQLQRSTAAPIPRSHIPTNTFRHRTSQPRCRQPMEPASRIPTWHFHRCRGCCRNAFMGPDYRDIDASLTKGFGLPNTRLLGENAKIELRADAFNLFNILNLNPSSVSSNITATNFGQDPTALGGRTITLQARFSF